MVERGLFGDGKRGPTDPRSGDQVGDLEGHDGVGRRVVDVGPSSLRVEVVLDESHLRSDTNSSVTVDRVSIFGWVTVLPRVTPIFPLVVRPFWVLALRDPKPTSLPRA